MCEPALPTERLLTVETAAELCGVGPRTIRAWARQRKLSHVRLAARTMRIPASSLARFLAARTVPGRNDPRPGQSRSVPQGGAPGPADEIAQEIVSRAAEDGFALGYVRLAEPVGELLRQTGPLTFAQLFEQALQRGLLTSRLAEQRARLRRCLRRAVRSCTLIEQDGRYTLPEEVASS